MLVCDQTKLTGATYINKIEAIVDELDNLHRDNL